MPSGLKRGQSSVAGPLVTRVASPPAAGSTHRSPRRATAIRSPSGLTQTCSPPPVIVRTSKPLLRTSLSTVTLISTGLAPAFERSRVYSRPSFSKA